MKPHRLLVLVLLAGFGCDAMDIAEFIVDDLPVPPSAEAGEEIGSSKSVGVAFINAIGAKDYKTAYGLTDSRYQKSVSLQRFTAGVSRNAYLQDSKLVACSSRTSTFVKNGMVSKDLCVLDSTDVAMYGDFFYAKGSGEWRVTGITLGGMPMLPAPGTEPAQKTEKSP